MPQRPRSFANEICIADQTSADFLVNFAQVTPNNTYLPLEHFYSNAKTRSRRAAYSFPITHENNCTNPNTSPTKTYDSYTWPDSVAPSKNVTPMPLTYHAGWVRLPKVKKAVPVSDRVLRSQVANKFVAKHKFRVLTVTPLNGLDFD